MKMKYYLLWLPLFLLLVACSEEFSSGGKGGRGKQNAIEIPNNLSDAEFKERVVSQVLQFTENHGMELDEEQIADIRELADGMDWSGDRNQSTVKRLRIELFEQARRQVLKEAQLDKVPASVR